MPPETNEMPQSEAQDNSCKGHIGPYQKQAAFLGRIRWFPVPAASVSLHEHKVVSRPGSLQSLIMNTDNRRHLCPARGGHSAQRSGRRDTSPFAWSMAPKAPLWKTLERAFVRRSRTFPCGWQTVFLEGLSIPALLPLLLLGLGEVLSSRLGSGIALVFGDSVS